MPGSCDAVARIGAPDTARIVVFVGFLALQRLAVVQYAFLVTSPKAL
jgi:uncharacterized PurR-regulated membrane protein YhhQ (DUF165 family)